jgi:hypothetical protein
MGSKIILGSKELEGVLLDAVYEGFKALQVYVDQEPEGWPDLTESEYLVGTDFVLKQINHKLIALLGQYHDAALNPRHRACKALLATWAADYVSPVPADPTHPQNHAWAKNGVECVMGMHDALFTGVTELQIPDGIFGPEEPDPQQADAYSEVN